MCFDLVQPILIAGRQQDLYVLSLKLEAQRWMLFISWAPRKMKDPSSSLYEKYRKCLLMKELEEMSLPLSYLFVGVNWFVPETLQTLVNICGLFKCYKELILKITFIFAWCAFTVLIQTLVPIVPKVMSEFSRQTDRCITPWLCIILILYINWLFLGVEYKAYAITHAVLYSLNP